ncbi:MAG: efflux RND transporter permease subunit, partial [Verrucomicrobia bacterium]|nr:efflux RND transporter permease subunit [Verrucomicrobiota bacterium]
MPTPAIERGLKRGAIAWMANNPVTANLIMMSLLIGGVISFLNIKQEVFPDFELDAVNISVVYPGASPEEVERGIILAVEEAVRGIEGVEKVSSSSREGVGMVVCELLLGADRQKAYQDIQQEVARITTFPEDAEEVEVALATRRREVMQIALYGDESERTLRMVAEQVRDELLQNEHITQVDLTGVHELEISVSIPQDTLRAYGLTVNDVARIIDAASVELPAGGVKTKGGEILLRVRDRRDWGVQFAKIPVLKTGSGRQVLLGEIATVEDGFEDVDRYATYDGKLAVMIEIFRVGDQTPIEVADAARRILDDLNATLPPGIKLQVLRDWSDIYRQRAMLLSKNGLLGLTLVLALLGVFLEARLALWVAMGIPVSFLGGLLLMPLFGATINMISMFAFLIALGIVVDDAIVVGENVYEYHQRGYPFLKAAIVGTREVTMPVIFSVLTNIVAFFPLFFVPGLIGKIWGVIPIVVIAVFSISLLECQFILPAHLGHGGDRKRGGIGRWMHERQQRFSVWFMDKVREIYGPALDWIMSHRYLTMAVGAAILIVTIGYVASGRLGMVPMPRVDADYSIVTAALPFGSSVQATERVRDVLESVARELGRKIRAEDPRNRDEVTGIYSVIGEDFRDVSGGHIVEVRAYLVDANNRPVNTREFTDRWRAAVGPIAGIETMQFESDRGGPGSGVSLSIQLSHGDSGRLEKAAAETAAWLQTFSNISDIDMGFTPGKAQFDFTILPGGLSLGLTSQEIARQLRGAFYGAEALRQQRGRNEVKVRVRLPLDERRSEQDIRNLLIRAPTGAYVPLFEVASPARGRSYTTIQRRDGRRVFTVTANVTPVDDSEKMLATYLAEKYPELRDKYPGLGYGFAGRQEDLRKGMKALQVGFLAAILMVYLLLAIPFRSYAQPLIIMVSIPFGIVGAVLGHLIMGYSMSMISVMGII